jgi:hypothetical protein
MRRFSSRRSEDDFRRSIEGSEIDGRLDEALDVRSGDVFL